ncbi:MAG: hypothetical protein MUE41_04510 [Gemmatimonadaceae bacterium]|jgi:hypothetical protein|nr:hypothetical protein [Gemmatimonadaceae bacterium]
MQRSRRSGAAWGALLAVSAMGTAPSAQAQERWSVAMFTGVRDRSARGIAPSRCSPPVPTDGGLIIGAALTARLIGRVALELSSPVLLDIPAQGGNACLELLDPLPLPAGEVRIAERTLASDRVPPRVLLASRASVTLWRAAEGGTTGLRVLAGPAFAPARGTIWLGAGAEVWSGRTVQFRLGIDRWHGRTRHFTVRETGTGLSSPVVSERLSLAHRAESMWMVRVGLAVAAR